jgi:hypothetical protein
MFLLYPRVVCLRIFVLPPAALDALGFCVPGHGAIFGFFGAE